MSLNQLSPGVNVREIDLTNFIPNVGVSGGAFVGRFAWGPVLDYTVISDSNRLAKVFGKPTDENFEDWYSVSNFLSYTNNCNVIRVVHNEGGVEQARNAAAIPSGVVNNLIIKNDAQFSANYGTGTAYLGKNFAAKFPGRIGNSLRVIMVDSKDTFDQLPDAYRRLFDFKPGTSSYADSLGGSKDEVHIVVVDDGGLFTGVPGSVLEKYSFLSKASDGRGNDNAPNYFGNVVNSQSDYIRFLAPDFSTTYLVQGFTVASVSVVEGGQDYVTGQSVTISAPYGGGTTATAVVTASKKAVSSVTIDQAGTDYVVDDAVVFSAPFGAGTAAIGRVSEVGILGEILEVEVTHPGSGYAVGEVVTATVTSVGGSGATLTVATSGGAITAVTITNSGGSYDFGQTLTAVASTETGSSAVLSAELSETGSTEWGRPVLDPTTAVPSHYAQLSVPYDVRLTGGDDGGFLDEGDLIEGWDMFQNAEEVEVSLLFAGSAGGERAPTSSEYASATISGVVVNHIITKICEERKDCILFFSPQKSDVVDQSQENAAENVVAYKESLNTNSSYAVMDSGWKLQYDVYNDKYRWIPLNADIAGLCAATDTSFDPWWSPAGFNRGKIKGVVALAFNPNKTQRDILYSSNVNPVVSFKSEGVVLYGDRTQQTKASAFQYINVRRLFIVLEKAISRASKYQLFEFNDQFTRAQFKAMVEPYLREVQGRRGIYDFRVICDETNNTPEIIDRAEFVASIFIKPARSINFITLNFVAVRTGVEFSEVAGAV